MRESVLSKLVVCKVCKKAYLPSNDVCDCIEEPRIENWEDVKDKSILSKWQEGAMSL